MRKALTELLVIIVAALLLIVGTRIGTSARSDESERRVESAAVRPEDPGFSNTITTGATAQQLAQAMGVNPADIVSVELLGSNDPQAVGIGSTPLSYFPTSGTTYAILCTGNAANAEVPNASGGNWNTDLSGNTIAPFYDAVQLHLKLKAPAGMTCMSFDFAFYSEEFPEYLNSSYNDAFLAEKGQTNIVKTSDPVTFRPVISSQYNFAFDTGHNTISVNSAFGISANTGNAYDGVTPLLKAQTAVTPGSTVDVYLTIGDVGDAYFDSAVFLDNFQWRTDANCASGAVSEGQFLPPDVHQKWTRSIRVDSNGNGRPDEQDETIDLIRDSSNTNFMTAKSARWGQSTVEMANPNPQTGEFQSIIHRRPQPALAATMALQGDAVPAADTRNETTVFTFTGLDAMMRPANFAINQTIVDGTTTVTRTGQGGAVDTNSDGKPDVFEGQGTGHPLVSISPVYSDINGDGKADFASIPWSLAQAGAIGVDDSTDWTHSQVWIPLGDTNGDGIPDSPAFDFNHDNKPDPGLITTPIVAGPANPTADYYLNFPHFVDYNPLFSQIYLMNLDRAHAASAEVTVREQDGDPMGVTLNGQLVSGGQGAYSIPAGGMKILKSSGQGTWIGSVQVKSNRPLAGVVSYQGTGFGAAGVGASADLAQGFVAPIRKSVAYGIDAGVAVMNLEDFPVTLNPELFLNTGARTGDAYRETIPAHGQIALMLADFDWNYTSTFTAATLSDYTGMLRIAASGRVAAAALQTRAKEYAALPVVANANPLGIAPAALTFEPEISMAATATTPRYELRFPQFANGGTPVYIASHLYVFNQNPLGPAQVTAYFKGDNGQPLNLSFAPNGEYAFTVPSNALRLVSTNGQGSIAAGSVTLASDRAVAGTLIWISSLGVAGVGASQELSQGFVAPMETGAAGQVNTGIAVQNLTDSVVTLNLELVDLNGAVLSTATVTIPARGHLAKLLGEFGWSPARNLATFQGILRATSGGAKVAATVIQTRPGQYVTMPVAPRLP